MAIKKGEKSKIISNRDEILNDLPEVLKDFENKVFLERLKNIEKTNTAIQKQITSTKKTLDELKQLVYYIASIQEEIAQSLSEPFTEEDTEELMNSSKFSSEEEDKTGNKKWN